MSILPVAGKITSEYGERVLNGVTENHKGIDIGVPVGTDVKTLMGGTVKSMGYSSARGNYVIVQGDNGYSSLYQHLSKATVAQGARISSGQTIGLSGNTGNSTGPHLHYEVFKDGVNINPLDFGSIGGALSANFANFDVAEVLKANWLLIAGALVVVAVLNK